MPRDPHDAYDVDVPSSLPSLSRGQLSRRRLLGGVLSAAALGAIAPARAAARGTALDGAARSADIRRTNTLLRLGSNENPCGLGPAAKDAFLAAAGEANRYPGRAGQVLVEALAAQHKVEPAVDLPDAADRASCCARRRWPSPRRRDRWWWRRRRSRRRAAPPPRSARRCTPCRSPPTGVSTSRAWRPRPPARGCSSSATPTTRPARASPRPRSPQFVAAVKATAPEARILVDEAYFDYVDDPGLRHRGAARAGRCARVRHPHVLEDSSAWPASASATRSRIPTRSRRCASRARAAR